MTNGRLPRLPFFAMKNAVLGKTYELSLVFTENVLSQKLNKKYKKKNRPANVLSFPLGAHEGEMFINIQLARRESHMRKGKYRNHVGYLFIHGLFHLKGYRHNSTMEKEEARIRNIFSITE